MLLEKLFSPQADSASGGTEMTPIEQLAIIVMLRRVLGSSTKINIVAIHRNTQVVFLMKALVNWINGNPLQQNRDYAEIQYYFEQELGWILINLAQGSNEVVH